VEFLQDPCWAEAGIEQLGRLAYFVDLLKKAAIDETSGANRNVSMVLRILQTRGSHHGGQASLTEASTYAAMHSIVFRDQVPLHDAHNNGVESGFQITIGGRGERLFNEIREYITVTANPAGFSSFLEHWLARMRRDGIHAEPLAPLLNGVDVETVKKLQWRVRSMDRRSAADVERPGEAAWLITTIGGQKPPYYYDQTCDVPHGSCISQHLTDLRRKFAHEEIDRHAVNAYLHDYSALIRHQTRFPARAHG
jgi:hypothetical protein